MLPESNEYRERLVYERVNYGCIHSGKTKQRNTAYIGVRSQKIGCQARIRACIAKDKLKVMLYSMKHNHIVSNTFKSSTSTRKSLPVSVFIVDTLQHGGLKLAFKSGCWWLYFLWIITFTGK